MSAYEYYPIDKYDAVYKAVTAANEYIQKMCDPPTPTVRARIDEFCEDCVEVLITWPFEQATHTNLMVNIIDIQTTLQSVIIKSFIDGFIAHHDLININNQPPEEPNESRTD